MNQTLVTDTFISAPDGLKLHVRSYGPPLASTLPVVCLPGLTRTVADFEPLATALATDPTEPRRVLALDYRGRGESEYDRDPNNYALPVELADVMAVLTALDVGPAVFIGTSRGGLITMLLAVSRPTALAGVILNDIGPVVEPQGLMRIKSYVGKLPTPRSYEEGAEILRRLFAAQFPKFAEADWLAYARRTWKEKDAAARAGLRRQARHHPRGGRFRASAAAVMAAVRRAGAGSPDGHPRCQLGHPVARHGGGDARAPLRHRHDRGAGPGPCTAPGRTRSDPPHRQLHRVLRDLGAALTRAPHSGSRVA